MNEGDDSEVDPVVLRRVAEIEITSSLESKRLILEEHSAAFRWMLGSLLAINGSAALAIAGFDPVPVDYKVVSIAACVIGILGGLSVAVFGQKANRGLLEPLAFQTGYWLGVAADGERSDAVEKQIVSKMQAAMGKAAHARMAGFVSAAMFVIAVTVAGYGVLATEKEKSQSTAVSATLEASPKSKIAVTTDQKTP